jgi:V/A-type H+/Na+-transporting ATPase subunit F
MTYRIAIVGQKETVAAFSLLGVDVVSVSNGEEAVAALFRLKRTMQEDKGIQKNAYAVVFITEDLATSISPDDEKKLQRGALPAIIPLPSLHEADGASYGLKRIKRIVERAIGSDILQ